MCIPAQARSARTPRPQLSHGPRRNCGGGGVSKEWSGRHVSFSPGSWEEGQPRVPHARLLRCSLLVSRAAHDSGRVNISSLADLAGDTAAAAKVRSANPFPPKEKFSMPSNWPAKVLGCPASLQKRETVHARLAGLETRSGCRASPAPGTLGTSHGPGGTKCALLRARASGWSWQQRQAQPGFPSAPGEASNKSCLSHFITLLARADSGPDLASPRSSLCTSRATESLCGPG